MGAIRHEEHSMSRSELSVAPQAEVEAGVEARAEAGVEDLIEADSLVEEVSIDGMCGVY
jgi:mycofactocin precursor